MGDPQEGSHERGPCEVLFFGGGGDRGGRRQTIFSTGFAKA